MKGGADLLRAEIKNCIICLNTVSPRQLLPLTPDYVCAFTLLNFHAAPRGCCEGGRCHILQVTASPLNKTTFTPGM